MAGWAGVDGVRWGGVGRDRVGQGLVESGVVGLGERGGMGVMRRSEVGEGGWGDVWRGWAGLGYVFWAFAMLKKGALLFGRLYWACLCRRLEQPHGVPVARIGRRLGAGAMLAGALNKSMLKDRQYFVTRFKLD